MTASLYDLSAASYLQTVEAAVGFLGRAAEHCVATGAHPDDFVGARLIDDMAPFHFHAECISHHSISAVDAVRTGVFDPPPLRGPIPFAELQAMTAETAAALRAIDPEEVNGWAGKALDLQIGPRRLRFTAETFFLSFSLPNFHFHTTIAYAILRERGVPIGKRDYEGRLRVTAG